MAMPTPINRILIVEDDPSIRALVTRHFRRKGFQVEQAAAAEEALERFPDAGNRFDVILTDVHLPGQSGVDLARRIHEAKPDQPVVFMTGDADETIARGALADGAAGYLLKPFEFFELDAVVNTVLQRRSATLVNKNAVVRPIGESAHVTRPAKVVLRSPSVRRSRTDIKLRIAVAAAAFAALAFIAGTGIVA